MFAFKNNIGLVLLAIFLTSIFPGANAPGEITDLPDEPLAAAAPGSEGVALQWVLPGMPPKGFDSMYAELNEHLAAKTGDTVKFTFLDWGDFESKKSIYYASGETIDLIFSANWFSYEDDVMKGFYYPLDDIIDKLAPKTKKVLGDSVIKAAMVDGELYALPVPGQTSAFSSGLVFRKDLVDKYKIDLSKIKKLEDIEPILSLVKKRQPEIIPLVNCTSKRPFYDLAGLQSMGYDDHIPGALSDDLNDNKVYNEFASPGTMTFFKTLHKFNKAGYLKKYTNQDSGELFCKLMSDANPLLSGYSLGYNWVFVNIGKPTLTKYSATCYMNSIWAHSRYPERAVSMMEFINNDAISSNLLHFGVEGKHYVKISDNVVDYPSGASISKPAYEQYVNWMIGNRYLDFTWKNEDANTYKKLEDFNKTASTSRAIGFEFNNSPVKEESASCKEQVAKYIEGLMNGEYDPAKYLPVLNSALEKAGLNKVLTEKQKQFEAWVADQAALNIKDTSGIKLKLDGEPLTLKYPPVFSNGVPMVPMKQIFDSLDAVYAYDAKAKTVTARKNGNSLKLTLGNSVGSFNGKNIKLAAPPELINGQVYVPLESVCSSLGFEYSWNAAGKTAEITRGFTETNGNTWGNIANCGYVANDDIWQYFSMQDGIYRFKNDGSAITKLSDKPGAFLNAAGGWLYYLDSGAKSTDMHLRLYKMKTDGSLNTLLTPDRAYYANLMGEWIYYINLSDGDKPYRIHINGGEPQKLSDMAVMSLYADNGWIYYQKKSNKNIYRMRTSGTDVMQLTNTVGVDNRIIHMRGDWIYYSGAAGSMQGICKMRTDGSGKKFIVDVEFGGINMDEENIYCNDYGDLYRINEEKKEKIKIGSDIGEAINICGDWIYYTVTDGLRSPLLPYLYNEEEDTSEEFRLSKDGSVKQIIVPGKDGKITDIFRLPAMGFYTPVPIYAPAASSGYTIKTAKEIARQKNAVVSIKVYDEKGNLRASGSGFNIESTGTVVTNFHVIEGASAIKCSFDNGKTYDTDYILNYNYIKDIAILKLKDASGLPVVTLGNSDRVELADDVLAIGNPMDMQNTISDGLISGVRSILGIKYIQTTASISYGSSGGPLFNMSGEVIGVTSMTLMDSQNMNFAVPINSVRKLFHSARCIPIQAVNNYDIEVVEFEDNDSIAKANSLNMDSIIDANLYSSQDKDVFKFELKTDGNVTFTGTFDYHYLDTERIFEIKLLDRNGAVLKESEEILVEETRLQSVTADLKAGTYYVSISGKPVIDSSGKIMPGYTVLCIEN